jgi:L-ascorbate metabolism protein UlaG (beta-lactamase superfamily)
VKIIQLFLEGKMVLNFKNKKILILFTSLFLVLSGLVLHAFSSVKRQSEFVDTEAGQSTVEVTYIGNEGFMIRCADKKILIDALIPQNPYGYVGPPPAVAKKMIQAEAPFDGIDLVLVSHNHLDHFDSGLVAQFLENSPASVLVSGPLVCDEVKSEINDISIINNRLKKVLPKIKSVVEFTEKGITVKMFRLRHGSRAPKYSMQNLAHLILMDGKKWLHLGDSTADVNRDDFELFRFDKENIDIAFIPYWDLLTPERRDVVNRFIRPKHIIPMHIRENDFRRVAKDIKKFYPEAVLFRRPMEKELFR